MSQVYIFRKENCTETIVSPTTSSESLVKVEDRIDDLLVVARQISAKLGNIKLCIDEHGAISEPPIIVDSVADGKAVASKSTIAFGEGDAPLKKKHRKK